MSGPPLLPVLASGERWAVIAKPSGMVLHPSHYSGQFRDRVSVFVESSDGALMAFQL